MLRWNGFSWGKRAFAGLGLSLLLAISADNRVEGCGGKGAGGAVGLGGRGGNSRGANSRPGGPGASDNTGAFPGAGSGPPAGAGQRPQKVPAALNSLADLNKYGIELRGGSDVNDVTAKDVQNVLVYARHYRPEETNGLVMTFVRSNRRRSSGVLGEWSSSGQSQIYSDVLDVVFHEGTHHVTLFGRNRRSKQIGNQVTSVAKQEGGGEAADNTLTRSYAQKNDAEFKAEFFTGLAGLERGVPLRFTLKRQQFNPDEKIRQLARTIFANAGT